MTDGAKEQETAGPPEGATTTAEEGDPAATEEIPPEQVLLEGLVVVPPQSPVDAANASKKKHPTAVVSLPPLRAEEPVQSLRGALAEVVGLAHLTHFRFELTDRPSEMVPWKGTAGSNDKNNNTASPPRVEPSPSSEALDEFGNLTKLVSSSRRAFAMVLERYDAASIKDHVGRLRSLLQGNAPAVDSLLDDDDDDEDDNKNANHDANTNGKTAATTLPDHMSSPSVQNLDDFFYNVSGERREQYQTTASATSGNNNSKKAKKKTAANLLSTDIRRWNELEELCKLPFAVHYSGYHPPPSTRRYMGDLVYLELHSHDNNAIIFVTATAAGFYVNQSTRARFDPSPHPEHPCYSHALLDCWIQASSEFAAAWKGALAASKERASLLKRLNKDPVLSFFRIAVRQDFAAANGKKDGSTATSAAALLDSSMTIPSWLVPTDDYHAYHPARTEDDLTQTHGIELRNGGIRDWNEELQMAREMPVDTLPERLERARILHKLFTEFGEASLLAVKAIADGHIQPMNPNEGARSQVFLHNNIFVSRAVDAGPETFKLAQGDAAARKAANRDIQCLGTFHRSEKAGLYTLATVLIDFLGTRYICQSILPGILTGEKSHTLLYGAVETGTPLKWSPDLHALLEGFVGEGMMLATRPVYRMPLTEERMAQVQDFKDHHSTLFLDNKNGTAQEDDPEAKDASATMETCIPIEAKGIQGSDQRQYLLDFGRLTPRDANWVSESCGGTGKFEALWKANQEASAKSVATIPPDVDDDEWTMHVLRPELVTKFTQLRMAKYFKAKSEVEKAKQKLEEAEKNQEEQDTEGNDNGSSDKKEEGKQADPAKEPETQTQDEQQQNDSFTDEDKKYLETLKLNLNVFLPHMRRPEGEAEELLKKDEASAREAAEFLWDEVIPRLSRGIKEGSLQPVPMDGRTLTEFLHRQGINCRYLGRIATLAREEEARDAKTEADLKAGTLSLIERRTMPKCWLEILEVEIVARSAKHVLDTYLCENSGIAASQPAQLISCFLSALVTERDETAAQTETRIEKTGRPDDDEFDALTLTAEYDSTQKGGIRSRFEVWQDIEAEIGRRFRYTLSLYNRGNKSGRALYIPLLRRFCQRTGIRLRAKNYEVGGQCLCNGGNTVTNKMIESYPISPLDVVDIVPLMKHASSYSEGFTPCSVGSTISLPPLQVSLRDARLALERAHIQTTGRALGKGLELAQEAASLYQKVTENAAHPGVIESIELMSTIFLEAGDAEMAAVNGSKTLALAIQSSGFDTPRAFSAHMALFQMCYAAKNPEQAIKHIQAAIYILEIMAGPRHTEIFSAFHKLVSVYSSDEQKEQQNATALKYLEEAAQRDSCDRLMDGMASRSHAKVHANLKEFKAAVEAEKKALHVFSMFLGREHQLSKESDGDLKKYMTLAIEQTKEKVESEKIRQEEAKADAVAAALAAAEDKKQKKNKKKKGKK